VADNLARRPGVRRLRQLHVALITHFTHVASLYFHARHAPAESTKSVQFDISPADCKNTMWCKQCRQDVPALASPNKGRFCCPRCGERLCADPAAAAPQPKAADAESDPSAKHAPAATSHPPAYDLPDYDDWELDDQLRHIERVLGTAKDRGRRGQRVLRRERSRLDPPHAVVPPWHVAAPAASAISVKPARGRAPAGPAEGGVVLPALIWLALSLGTMAFVCVGILLGWSLCTGRQELWTMGLPVAVCGQVALLVGLLLQLDRLWHHSRTAAAKLDVVDEQLHELKTTTTLLGTGHGPSAAFYSHLADGAGSQLLLSDLKSQLDLLALKMSMRDEG